MHDGCVKTRRPRQVWVASCHTSRPSSEGRATSFFMSAQEKTGNMFCHLRKFPHFFVFFVNCAKKKKTPHQTSLPASNSTCFFDAFFISFEVFRQMEKCWCYLGFRLVSSLHLGSGHFLEGDFPFPKKWGFPAVLGLKTNHQFTYPKNEGWFSCIFGLNNVIHGLWFSWCFAYIMAFEGQN